MMNPTNINTKRFRRLFDEKQYNQIIKEASLISCEKANSNEWVECKLIQCKAQIALGNYNSELIDKIIKNLRLNGDNSLYAMAKSIKAHIMISIGNDIEARELLNEAYVSFLRDNDLKMAASTLNRSARAVFSCGEIETAKYMIRKSIELLNQINEHTIAKRAGLNLALIHFRSGEYSKALSIFIDSKDHLSKTNDERSYKYYLAYALATALHGNIDEALKLIDETTTLPQEFKRERALYFEYLGWIYNLAGRYQDAITTLKTGIELSLKQNSKALH